MLAGDRPAEPWHGAQAAGRPVVQEVRRVLRREPLHRRLRGVGRSSRRIGGG